MNESWWKESIIYQIYPRSFCDSNGDGIGDIQGIISKLDYVKSLGVDAIWLSPIYKSPNEDNGYDISDYYAINPEFGTMEDFDTLMQEAKKRNLKIIMDLVINHTSSEHEWFQKSRNGDEEYKDYYYWSDSWENTPNNWTGFFGQKVWEYDDKRKAYYMHLFGPHQVDLNYHNPKVLDSVLSVIKFWLDKGVAGFRCDVINILWKDSLESSKKFSILKGSEHYLTLEGTHEILKKINQTLEPYNAFTVGETVFVSTKDAVLLTSPERKELSLVFGFEHMETDQFLVKWFRRKFKWKRFISVLDKWQKEVPWNSIYFENHDQLRSVSRYGSEEYREESAKLLATLLLTLRGTPFIYEGEELGMTNFIYRDISQLEDVESKSIYSVLSSLHLPKRLKDKIIRGGTRDYARTPMQWSDEENGGFTSGKPWLSINENYKTINVKEEESRDDSVLSYYKELIELRKKSESLIKGGYLLKENSKHVTIIKRDNLGVYLNHSDKRVKHEIKGKVILNNYRGLENGYLLPWQAIICEE